MQYARILYRHSYLLQCVVAVVSVVDWEVDNALLNVARGEAAESCRHTPNTRKLAPYYTAV